MVSQRNPTAVKQGDLVALVDHYIDHHRRGMNRYLDWFQKKSSIREAIAAAALSVDWRGNRFPNQGSVPEKALMAAKQRLSASAKSLGACESFQALVDKVGELLEPVPDLGDRYVFDVSVRLGSKLGRFPQKIYLHAGTREVAKGIDRKHGSPTVQAMDVDALPAALRVLPAHELEDLLCRYKECLAGRCSP